MTCGQVKEILMNIALQEAEPGDQGRIQAHLEACESCRVRLRELNLTRKLLVQGLPQEEPPQRIAFIAPGEARAGRLGWLWQRAFAVPLGIAAALVLVLVSLSLAQARVSFGQGRWELAFGAPRTVTEGAPTAMRAAAPALTREQVQQMIAAAMSGSEQRQRAQAASLVDTSDRRHVLAVQTIAEQMKYLQQTQNVFYKESEGTRSEVAMLAAQMTTEKGAPQ